MKAKILGALAVGLLVGPMTALAVPLTFQFQLPLWDANNDAARYGADAVVTVTVDNGSASVISQSFQNSQIVQVAIDTAGTYSNSWVAGDVLFNTDPLAVFISTTGTGVPLLALDAIMSQRIVFSNASGTWQFGAGPDYTQTWVTYESAFGTNSSFAYHSDALRVFGTYVGVPEPGTLALLGLGLAGLGLSRRRKMN